MTRRSALLSLALVSTLGSTVVAAVPASAGKVQAETGCYDITGAQGADYVASTGKVQITFDLAAPACRKAVYSLRVFDGSGDLATTSAAGDGRTSQVTLTATVPVAPDQSVVGIEVTTSYRGVVVDTAPDPVAGAEDLNTNGIPDQNEVQDGGSPALSNFK